MNFMYMWCFSRLFWTDWDRDGPRIEACNLDGTDRIIFVDALLEMPNSLAVDFKHNKLCWTDGGSNSQTDETMQPFTGPKIGNHYN